MAIIKGRKYYTVAEMAALVNRSQQWVRLLIKQRRIVAFYEAKTWFIPASHARRWRCINGVMVHLDDLLQSESAILRK